MSLKMSSYTQLVCFIFFLTVGFWFVIGESPGEIQIQKQTHTQPKGKDDGGEVQRRFESIAHAIFYKKYRILPPAQLIEYIVKFLKEKYGGELNLALDVGCGSGQSTFVLAEHFKNVLGTDISPNQIAQAKTANHHGNVKFEVSGAETMDLGNGTVQLVTASIAVHWLNLPVFFSEAHRVLSPGGVIALYSYGVADLKFEEDPSKTQKLNQVYKEEIYLSSRMRVYWPKKHALWLNKYRDIIIPEPPFVDFSRSEDKFIIEKRVNINYIFGHLQSSSVFQKLRENEGEEAAQKYMEEGKKKILAVIAPGVQVTEDVLENTYLTLKHSFFLLIARKPTN